MKNLCLNRRDGKLVVIKVHVEVAGGYSIPNTVSYVIKELTQLSELLEILRDSHFFSVTSIGLKSTSVLGLLSIVAASHELYFRKLLKQELGTEGTNDSFGKQPLLNFIRVVTAFSKVKISVGSFVNTVPKIFLLFNVPLQRKNPVLLGLSGLIFIGGYLSQLDLFANNYTSGQLNRAALILLETALVVGVSATSYFYFPEGYEYIPPLYAGLVTFLIEATHLSFSKENQLLVERVFRAIFLRKNTQEPDYARLMGIYHEPQKNFFIVARAVFSATAYSVCNLMLLWGNGHDITKFCYEKLLEWTRSNAITSTSPWFYVLNSPLLVIFPLILVVGEIISYYRHALRARGLSADTTSFAIERLFAIGTTQYRTLTSSWFAISILLANLNTMYSLVSPGIASGAVIGLIGLSFASVGTRPNFAVLAEYLRKLPFVACLPQFFADSLATVVAAAACYMVSPEVVPEFTVLFFNLIFTLNTVLYFLTGECTVTNVARIALMAAQKLKDGCCPRDLNEIELEGVTEDNIEDNKANSTVIAFSGVSYEGVPNPYLFGAAANDRNKQPNQSYLPTQVVGTDLVIK